MTIHKRSRIYFGYTGSTTQTTTAKDQWGRFPTPSVPLTTYRDSGDFTLSEGLKITYNRDIPAWFDIESVCNVYRVESGNVDRNVEVVWYLNGQEAGPVRGCHMNNLECNILSGAGQVYLHQGDILEPMIRNISNGDKVNIRNCSFNIREDFDWGH